MLQCIEKEQVCMSLSVSVRCIEKAGGSELQRENDLERNMRGGRVLMIN